MKLEKWWCASIGLAALPALAQDPNIKFLDPNLGEYRLEGAVDEARAPSQVRLTIRAGEKGAYAVERVTVVGDVEERLSGTATERDGQLAVRFAAGAGAAGAVQQGQPAAAIEGAYTILPDGRIRAELKTLVRNGIESTFLSAEGKKRLHTELDAFLARIPATPGAQ